MEEKEFTTFEEFVASMGEFVTLKWHDADGPGTAFLSTRSSKEKLVEDIMGQDPFRPKLYDTDVEYGVCGEVMRFDTVGDLLKFLVKDSIPVPRYYIKNFDLDGTAEELYTQARNGYITDIGALHHIEHILKMEKNLHRAEQVRYMAEREQELLEDPDAEFTLGQLKLDFVTGQPAGVEGVCDGSYILDITFDRSGPSRADAGSRGGYVLVHITELLDYDGADCTVTMECADSIPFDEFRKMDRRDFKKRVNEAAYYGMQETDRTYHEHDVDISHDYGPDDGQEKE